MYAIPYIYIEIFFFSFCGTYLASQGCSPDQNLTIWNWENEEMVAQKAAPASEHYHLAFSHEHHTKITSCGKVFFVKLFYTICIDQLKSTFFRHSSIEIV